MKIRSGWTPAKLARRAPMAALAASAAITVLTALFLGIVAPVAPAAAAAAQVSVTGEVIDSNCYIQGGSKGESHRACAQSCAEAGVPLALLEDGSNKVIWLASKKDMETPNKQLLPYAGRKVTIKGSYAERGGARILLVDSVQPAAAKAGK